MGRPYSLDLRESMRDFILAGHSCREAARVFGVGVSTAIRIAHSARTCGDVAPKAQGRPAGRFGKLAPYKGFLIEIVEAEPDITLAELACALEETHGVKVNPASIHRALARAGFTYKKRAYSLRVRAARLAQGAGRMD